MVPFNEKNTTTTVSGTIDSLWTMSGGSGTVA